jgi:hypothetical protein
VGVGFFEGMSVRAVIEADGYDLLGVVTISEVIVGQI